MARTTARSAQAKQQPRLQSASPRDDDVQAQQHGPPGHGQATSAAVVSTEDSVIDTSLRDIGPKPVARRGRPPKQSSTALGSNAGRSTGLQSANNGAIPLGPSLSAPQVLSSYLGELSQQARGVLDNLAPSDMHKRELAELIQDLDDPQNGYHEFLPDLLSQFEQSCAHYTVDPFIDVPGTVQSIFSPDTLALIDGPVRRPDDVLYQANLALAVKEVHDRYRNAGPLADSLGVQFPAQLLASLQTSKQGAVPGGTRLVQETFNLALDVRTQLAIEVVITAARLGQDVEKRLHHALMDGNNLRDWAVPGLRQMDLERDWKIAVMHRKNLLQELLREFLKEQNNPAVFYERFPVDRFMTTFLRWARVRGDELQQRFNRAGGLNRIVMASMEEVARQSQGDTATLASTANMGVQEPKSTAMGTGALSFGSFNGPQIWNRFVSTFRGEQSDNQSGSQQAFYQQPLSADSPLNAAETDKENRQPERSLFDRHASAQRVPFLDSQGPAVAQMHAPNGQSPTHDIDAEGEEDQAFQTQPAPTSTSARRTGRKRQNAGNDGEAGPSTKRPRQTRRKLDTERNPAPLISQGAGPQAENYRAVNARAKEVAKQWRAVREPKPRRPWTDDETEALINAIGQIGTSWSAIKRADDPPGSHVLRNRDQVALKDKARNILFDNLKAGVTLDSLPRNLHLVPLHLSQKTKLREMNVPWIDDFLGPQASAEQQS